jgi:hypothetical protein
MVAISFTRSTGNPVNPPVYDPRENLGISFHYNSGSDTIWLGLAKSGISRWGQLSTLYIASSTGGSNVYTVNPPVVTTSNLPPDFSPQFIPSEGRIHFHISYLADSNYHMYVGTAKSPGLWAIYDILSTI